MNTYELKVLLVVKVDAPDECDAVELMDEALGEGDYINYEITHMDITGISEA